MRVVSLHPDVLVATSRVWQTTCTVLRSDEEAFVLDSPILPDELEVLPALLEQACFPALSGLLATHADWDHLLGRLAFPQAALGCARSSVERLGANPGEAQRELRAFDERHYVTRPGPLALGSVQTLEAPGRCEIGHNELELYEAAGHTRDGMAIWAPWAKVLVAGDYLSCIEIPVLGEGGSIEAYVHTLERLRPLLAAAEHVVPGHGPVLDPREATAVLEEDLAYLDALSAGGEPAELPPRRRTKAQRDIHAANLAALDRS